MSRRLNIFVMVIKEKESRTIWCTHLEAFAWSEEKLEPESMCLPAGVAFYIVSVNASVDKLTTDSDKN
jgi:hypothetical protein